MALLHFLRSAPREAVETTLMAKIGAKIACHMVNPHQWKLTTMINFNFLTHDVMEKMVLAEGDISPCKHQPVIKIEAMP